MTNVVSTYWFPARVCYWCDIARLEFTDAFIYKEKKTTQENNRRNSLTRMWIHLKRKETKWMFKSKVIGCTITFLKLSFFFSSFKPSVWGNFCIKLMGMKLWVKKAIYLFSQEGFLASNGAKGVKGRGHIDFFSCCCCCFFSFNVNPF